jgi:phosphoglycolate phosphatase
MNRCAIFDLDGTLVDSPRGVVTTFAAVFAQLDLPTVDSTTLRGTLGLPLPAAFAKLLGAAEDDPVVTACVTLYRPTYRKVVLPMATRLVFPGVYDGLRSLRDEGFRLAVATSKFSGPADELLSAAGLREEFSVVVAGDQVARPKPDPDSGLLLLRRLGVAPQDAVVVGDTTFDIGMAHGAGMASVAVTYGLHGVDQLLSAEPTWLVDSFAGVVAAVRECA